MDQILTEQDLNEVETWNKLSPHRWCLIVTRARALLAQRDALKAELVCAHEAMETERARADRMNNAACANKSLRAERDTLIKERDDAMLRAQKAVRDEMRNNEELTECRHALGGFAGPTYGISEEVKKVVAARDTLVAHVKELEGLLRGTKNRLIDFPAPSTSAVNPAKQGLQPMKCPCGGQIEFGRERVGHCMNCGASCRVMDPPPTVPSCQPVGHMIHIPAEYCGDSSRRHAYADGYLAGKGAK